MNAYRKNLLVQTFFLEEKIQPFLSHLSPRLVRLPMQKWWVSELNEAHLALN